MPKSKPPDPFAAWLKAYRAAARRDRGRSLGKRLEEFGLDPSRAPEALEDTIYCVALAAAFYRVDGREGLEAFLSLQTYDVATSGARYLLRFEPFGVAFLLVDELRQVDLVDLFDAPPGYRHLYMSRVDGKNMTKKELKDLAKAIEEDFHYDYEPDEIVLDFHATDLGIAVEVYETEDADP